MHVVRAVAIGIFGRKESVHLVVHGLYSIVRRPERLPGIHVDDQLEKRHLRDVELLPFGLVGEQGDALGMVDQVVDAVRREVGQDRNDHGLIGVDGQVGHAPAGTVLRADSDLVAFLEAELLEDEMELLDLRGHLGVVERLAADVVEGRLVPEFPGCILQSLQVVRVLIHYRFRFFVLQ